MNYKEYMVKVYENGAKEWYQNGKLHREDGPACEYADGRKYWFQNGQRHREDGPAREYVDGTKYWYRNGKYHRKDGPAIEWADGTKLWYLNGVEYSEKDFLEKTKRIPSCDGKVVEIDGKKYKLTEV